VRSILVSYAGYPYTFNSLMPDNGLANLAGALLRAGHETLILDYGTVENLRRTMPKEISSQAKRVFASMASKLKAGEGLGEEERRSVARLESELAEAGKRRCAEVCEELYREIERFKPHFLGFKLWNGDGFSGSIKIAEKVKARYKNVKVFGGGPHVDVFGENIYRATDVFDCVAYAEGEGTILQLAEFAQGKRQLHDVNNVIFKSGSSTIHRTPTSRISDLNTLALPCYEESVYPSMRGNSKIKILVLDESRGCRFACHFCIHPLKSGRGLRCKSAKRIVEEMRRATDRTGSRAFRYAGSSTPPDLAKETADLIVREGLDVKYTGFGNFIDAVPDYMPVLAESGCRSLAFGMESGSERILKKAMGKPIKLKRMSEVFEATKRARIFTVVAVIFPAPFETKESEAETLAFIRDVRPDSVSVLFPAVYPGTRWAAEKERFGFAFDEMEYVDAVMMAKAKLLFPMDFWDDLPYSLSGRNFRGIVNETARLTGILERDGILTSLTDDFVLMALLGGYAGQERKLRDLGRLWFFTGDVEGIEGFVEEVNANATVPRPE